MAIKISGSTIIDDSRVIVNADKIGIGTPSPNRDLEILSTSATGIGISAVNSQSTDINRAISVFNAGITSTFAVSYKGKVEAAEYHGTFKGTIDSSVAITNANKLKINTTGIASDFTIPFISTAATNSSYQDFFIDNDQRTSLRFNPNDGRLQINGSGRDLLTIRTTSNSADRAIAFQNSGNNYVGAFGFIDRSSNQADLAFFTGNASATLNNIDETMRLTKESTVGIGTTRPDGLLHVFDGDAIVTGGSVGIGTTIPGTNIHISGTGQNGIRIDTDATGLSFHNYSEFMGFMGNDSGKLFINAGGTQDTLLLRTGGAERISIIGATAADGRVGIGSTIPTTKLDVFGQTELDDLNVSGVSTFTSNINANGNIVGDNATAITGISRITGSTVATMAVQNVQYVGRGADPYASSFLHFNDQNVPAFGSGGNFTTLASISGLNLVFDSNDNDNNGLVIGSGSTNTSLMTTHMVVSNVGNIGIGTTKPVAKLDVAGKILAGDSITHPNLSNTLDTSANSGETAFRPINLIDTSSLIKLARLHDDFGPGLDLLSWNANLTTLRGRSLISMEGGDLKVMMRDGSSTLEKLRITSAGDVGIGTTNPIASNINTALQSNTSTLAVGILTAKEIFGPITGTLNPTGNLDVDGVVTAISFESTVATGTAPFVVASTTKVANLNADLLDDKSTANSKVGNTVVTRNAAGGFSAGDVTFDNIVGVSATFTGNVSIAGTLTYEDVTNVDAIGLITARSGIHVTGAGVSVTGISTFINNVEFRDKVGIGEDDPQTLLDVLTTTEGEVVRLRASNNTRYLKISSFNAGHHGSAYDFDATSVSGAFSFSITNDEKLRITKDGTVGIGTISPASMLHIHSGTPRITMSDSGTGAHHRINADSSVGNFAFDIDYDSFTSTPAFIVNIKGDEKLRVTSGGDVGIGTFNPTGTNALTNNNSTLAVGIVTANEYFGTFKGTIDPETAADRIEKGNTKAQVVDTGSDGHFLVETEGIERLRITSTGITSIKGADDQDNFIVDVNATNFVVHTDATDGEISLRAQDGTASNNSKFMTFYTQESGSAAAEKLRITTTGNIGINTDNPEKRLDVLGTFRVKDESGKENLQIDGANGIFQVFQTKSAWTNLTYNPSPILAWDFKSGPGDLMYMASGGNTQVSDQMALVISDNHGFKVGRSGYDGTDFDISSTAEYFRVTNDGKVGIGSTISTAKLEVLEQSDNTYGNGVARFKYFETDENALRLDVLFKTSGSYHKTFTTGGGTDFLIVDQDNTAGRTSFAVEGDAGNNKSFTVDSTGLVGINSTVPQTRLDVIDSPVGRNWTPTSNVTALFERNNGSVITLVSNTSRVVGIDFADTGDNNRGFIRYDHSDDSMFFRVDGGERLRITSGGDVGIGTTIPTGTNALTNNNSTLAVGIVTANEYFGTFKGTIDSGATGTITNANNVNITNDEDIGNVAHYIHFGDATSGYDGVKVDSTGLVYKDSQFGLGTNSPGASLHISTTLPRIRLTDTNDSNIDHFISGSGSALHFQADENQEDGATATTIRFSIDADEKMRINASGQVGIGTDNPLQKLNVYNGTSSDTGGILVQNVGYDAGVDKPYLIVGTKNWTGATTNWNTFGFQHRIKSTDPGGTPRVTIDGANGEYFCVNNSGKVGIGGTTIPKALLDVNGTGTLAKFGSTVSGAYEALYIKNNVAGYPAITNESSDDTIELRSAGSVQATIDYNNNKTDKYFRVMVNGQSGIGSELFRVEESGKVGIGTNNPLSLLSLYSDADGEELIHFDMGSPDPALRRGWRFQQKDDGISTKLNLKSDSNGKSFLISDSSNNVTLQVNTSSTGGVANNGAYIYMYPLVAIGRTLAHIGDTDTKLEFPANNTIKFDTAGTERLRIDSDGKVGIGTITPNHKLHIQADNPTIALESNTTTGNTNIVFGDIGSETEGKIQYHNNGNYMRFFTNGDNERLRINSVGITSVQGQDDQDNFIVDVNGTEFAVHTDATVGEVSLRSQDRVGSTNSKFMTFYTQESGSAAAERLRITSGGTVNIGGDYTNTTGKLKVTGDAEIDGNLSVTGALTYEDVTNIDSVGIITAQAGIHVIGTASSVGIGTSAPIVKLHVVGNSKIEGAATFNNDVTISKDGDTTFTVQTSEISGDDALIKIRGARTNCNTCDIAMLQFDNRTSSAYTMAQISAMDPSAPANHLEGKGKLVFRTATGGTLSDQMTIREDGNVGINSTAPTAKLDVDGAIKTTSAFNVVDPDDGVTRAILSYSTGIKIPPQFSSLTGMGKLQSSHCDLIIRAGGAHTTNPYIHLGNTKNSIHMGDGSTPTDPTIPTFNEGVNIFAPVRMLNGDVGIGTTNPDSALHVINGAGSGYSGSFNARTSAIIEGDNINGTVLSIMGKSSGYSGLFFGDESQEFSGQIQYIHSSNSFRFVTSAGTDNLILDNGNVGIGTDNPDSALHVMSTDENVGILTRTGNGANLDLYDNDTQSRIRTVDGKLRLIADLNQKVSNSAIQFYVDNGLKLDINSDGDLLPGGSNQDIGATGSRWGVGYFDTINATNISGSISISNDANDRIVTATGSGGLNAEANLTFDGTDLFVANNIKHLGDTDTQMGFGDNEIKFDAGSSEQLRIQSDALNFKAPIRYGSDTSTLLTSHVYVRGTAKMQATGVARVVTLNGVDIIPNDGDGTGLVLVILNAGSGISTSSITRYNTHASTSDADQLATAIGGMTRDQLGILASYDACMGSITDDLRTAAQKVGLFKLSGINGHTGGQTRVPYAAIFRGTSNDDTAEINDAIEVVHSYTGGAAPPSAVITTDLASFGTSGRDAGISGAYSVSAIVAPSGAYEPLLLQGISTSPSLSYLSVGAGVSIIPSTSASNDTDVNGSNLGGPSNYLKQIYVRKLNADNITGTLTAGSDKQVIFNSSGSLTGSDNLVFDSSNKRLGIGYDTPAATLSVHSATLNVESEAIRLGRIASNSPDLRFHSIVTNHSATDSKNYIQFNVHHGGGDPYTGQKEVLNLLGNGNVGIGSTIPQVKLDVRGDILFNGNKLIASYLPTGNIDHIWSNDSELKGFNGSNSISNLAGGTWNFVHDGTSKVTGNSALQAGYILSSNGGIFMGDVGIGTTNPHGTNAVDTNNTATLAVGIVTAREYFGTFKGTIDSSVSEIADLVALGNDSSGSGAKRIAFTSADSGDVTIQVDTDAGATYTPSTGTITAQQFSGGGSGLTGVTNATTATNITAIDNSSTATAYRVPFLTAATGTAQLQTDNSDGITYKPSDGTLSVQKLEGTIVTAAQASITSVGTLTSLDVSGDVSINGSLTYEDVTNIDSVGVITAQNGIHVVGAGMTVVGVATFYDDVTISKSSSATLTVETSEFSSHDALIKIRGARTGLTNDTSMLQFDNSTNSPYIMAQIAAQDPVANHTNKKGQLIFRTNSGNNLTEKLRITSAGDVGIGTTNPTASNVNTALQNNTKVLAVGIVTANEYFGTFKGTIDSGGTGGGTVENANKVNIVNQSGADFEMSVLLSNDVTGVQEVKSHSGIKYNTSNNVLSVGRLTASSKIFVPDTGEIGIGNVIGTPDMKLYHQTGTNNIESQSGHGLTIRTDDFELKNGGGGDKMITAEHNGSVDLYYSDTKRFETADGGAIVTGILTATGFVGDGSGLTGIVGGISTTARSTLPGSPLTSSDFGKLIIGETSGLQIGVPINVFNPGNYVSIYNQTTGIISLSTVTAQVYLSGSNVSVSGSQAIKLSPRALATLTCIVGGSSPQFVISGGGVYT